jgi:hypothetical protein
MLSASAGLEPCVASQRTAFVEARDAVNLSPSSKLAVIE